MSFRILLTVVVLVGVAGYVGVRNSAPVQAFAATVYAIVSQDRDLLFNSGTPEEALETIAERHFPGASNAEGEPGAETAPEGAESAGPRDFSRRDRRTGNGFGFRAKQPRVPRIGN